MRALSGVRNRFNAASEYQVYILRLSALDTYRRMPPASAASFPARLLQALHTISQSSPRLIAPPATGTTSAAARKASVAISEFMLSIR